MDIFPVYDDYVLMVDKIVDFACEETRIIVSRICNFVVRFDYGIISSKVGFKKPDAKIFNTALGMSDYSAIFFFT